MDIDWTYCILDIQGFQSHADELVAMTQQCKSLPAIICANEAFLEPLQKAELARYVVVTQREARWREMRRHFGFARTSIASQIAFVKDTDAAERMCFNVSH